MELLKNFHSWMIYYDISEKELSRGLALFAKYSKVQFFWNNQELGI